MPWNPFLEKADTLFIDGTETPGLLRFEGVGTRHEFEVHDDPVGRDGGWAWFKGRKLARFRIRIELYSIDDWDAMTAMLPTLRVRPTGDKRSHSVEHPLLSAHEIKAVVFEEINGPDRQSQSEPWVVELSCIEYRKPKIEIAKVQGSKDSPVSKRQQEIADQSAENEALHQQLGAE